MSVFAFFPNSLIAQLSANSNILKSSVAPRCIFAMSGIVTMNSLLSIVSVDFFPLMLCICPFGSMMYSICLILLGSISSVVVASNLLDRLVIEFTTLSFSEKYHRWFPRSVQKRLRYITLRFSFGRTLSCMMNLSYPGTCSASCLFFIYANTYHSPPGFLAVSV